MEQNESEQINKTSYEQNLADLLMIAEASFIWSHKFLKLTDKYSNTFENISDTLFFHLNVSVRKVCKLAQHYNQLYFNEGIIHLTNLLADDRKIISLKNYGMKYVKNKAPYRKKLNELQNKSKDNNFKLFRDTIIAHKNEDEVESVSDNTKLTIDSRNYRPLFEFIPEIVSFMNDHFISNNNYIENYQMGLKLNHHLIEFDESIVEIIKLIETSIDECFKIYSAKPDVKLKNAK